ncbi:COG3308 Predicted membrane protein [Comamonadaceae bacterium]
MQAATPASSVVIARWVAVASLIALIILGLVWELWLAPTGGGTLALKVLPLCLPLAGLLKSRMYTYRWLSLMVWLYFTEGVVRAWSDKAPGNWLALLEVLLCIVLFVACTFHIRLRLKHAKALPANPEETTTHSAP